MDDQHPLIRQGVLRPELLQHPQGGAAAADALTGRIRDHPKGGASRQRARRLTRRELMLIGLGLAGVAGGEDAQVPGTQRRLAIQRGLILGPVVQIALTEQ